MADVELGVRENNSLSKTGMSGGIVGAVLLRQPPKKTERVVIGGKAEDKENSSGKKYQWNEKHYVGVEVENSERNRTKWVLYPDMQ